MSDGAISQDEIDALLAGVDMGGGSAPAPVSVLSGSETSTLTSFYTDALPKFTNNIAQLTGAEVSVSLTSVSSSNREDMIQAIPEMSVALTADFNAGLTGTHFYVTSPECATKIASCANNEENIELDEMSLSVVSECFSQISGSEITALSEKPDFTSLAANPVQPAHCPKAMVQFPSGNFVVLTYAIVIAGENYTMWEILAESVAHSIAKALGGGGSDEISGADVLQSMNAMSGMQQPMMNMGGMQQMQQPMMNMGGMQQMQQPMMNMGGMQQMQQPMMNMGGMQQMQQQMMNMNPTNVQSVQFPNLAMQQNLGEQSNINLIMDVYMEMTVELGRTKKLIKEILGMGEGSIIELDKLAGEPVDILVNHKPIAKGEVVVIDENFGVRVTEILSPIERISDVN